MHTLQFMESGGIYFHIPFCSRACHYCDFHFSTSLKYVDRMMESLKKELVMRKDFLPSDVINTIYFGGGTPSLLKNSDIEALLTLVDQNFSLYNPEITLEANPDDLTIEKLHGLKKTGINRLSIGVQTFNEHLLKWMNRSHNSVQAEKAIHDAKAIGFQNISLDLIFGYPNSGEEAIIEKDMKKIQDLLVPHISLYDLTIEDATVFGHRKRNGQLTQLEEDEKAEQFELIRSELLSMGYHHYEISNYALKGFESQHNSAYWRDIPYLGIGPSAHSYNGIYRWINVSNNMKYMKKIESGIAAGFKDSVDKIDLFNDYLIASIRTKWGADIGYALQKFNIPDQNFNWSATYQFEEKLLLKLENGIIILTENGKLLADEITARLMIV